MQYQFNAQQYQPSFGGGGGGLPTGLHKVIIEKTGPQEVKNKPDHHMLVLTLKAIEGPATGLTQDVRLNLIFPSNPQTVDIANQQLSAFCFVTATFAFQNTDELCNKPFYVDVAPQDKNDQYQEVKKIYDLNGNEAGKAPAGAQVAQPAAAAPAPPPQGGFGAAAPAADAPTGFGQAGGFGAAAPAAEAPAGFGAAQPAQGFGAAAPAPAQGFGAAAPAGAAPWGAR